MVKVCADAHYFIFISCTYSKTKSDFTSLSVGKLLHVVLTLADLRTGEIKSNKLLNLGFSPTLSFYRWDDYGSVFQCWLKLTPKISSTCKIRTQVFWFQPWVVNHVVDFLTQNHCSCLYSHAFFPPSSAPIQCVLFEVFLQCFNPKLSLNSILVNLTLIIWHFKIIYPFIYVC